MEGPTADLKEADEMMRVTVDLTDADVDFAIHAFGDAGRALKIV